MLLGLCGPLLALGFGLWTLLTRRLPPLYALATPGLLLALTVRFLDDHGLPLRGLVLDASLGVVPLWFGIAATCSLAAFLRPGTPEDPRTVPPRDAGRLLRWAGGWGLVCVPIAAHLSSDSADAEGLLYTVVPMVPLLLALYDSDRIRAVRRDLATLQFAGACLIVCTAAPHVIWAILSDHGTRIWRAIELVSFLIALPAFTLWSVGLRRPPAASLAVLALPLAVWSVASMVEIEAFTRAYRQITSADRAALPVASDNGSLVHDACIERPGARCPDGVDVLWVWPADLPIRDAIANRRGRLAVAGPNGIGTVSIEAIDPQRLAPYIHVTRTDGGYTVGGHPAPPEQAAAVIGKAHAACGTWGVVLDPAVDWTAQDLARLCEPFCGLYTMEACTWREDLGWTRNCVPQNACEPGSGGAVSCPQGGCSIDLYRAERGATVSISCPQGGCTVSAQERPVALDCAAGGCTVRECSQQTLWCPAGGCTCRP